MPKRSVDVNLILPAMLGYTQFIIWLFLQLLSTFKLKELVHQWQLLEARFQTEKDLNVGKQEIQKEIFKQISRELQDFGHYRYLGKGHFEPAGYFQFCVNGIGTRNRFEESHRT